MAGLPGPGVSSALPAPRVGTVLQGRYRLIAPIGDGLMGTVYRGERLQLERPVAVKVLHANVAGDPQFVKRFQIESRAMSRVSHPNCVSVLDSGVEGLPYIVMDLVDGVTLRFALAGGRLAPARAIHIARQILAALGHVHAQGILHRDIKPENVLLEQAIGFEDHVRLVDFGLAKVVSGADAGQAITQGVALGTPGYMAPELTREGPTDERVDLYSTGVLLFEMLAGRKPFVGNDPREVLLKHRDEAPPSLAAAAPGVQFSPALEEAVRRALEKEPGARFPSALAMRDALAAVPDAVAPTALPDATIAEGKPYGLTAAPGDDGWNDLRDKARATAAQVASGLSAAGAFLRRRRTPALIAAAVLLVAVLGVALRAHPRAAAPPTPLAPIRATRPPPPAPVPAPAAEEPAARADDEALAKIEALVASGDRKAAVAELRELRKANPEDARIADGLARLLLEDNRYEAGVAAARTAARLDPALRQDPAFWDRVIYALIDDGADDEAEDFLRAGGPVARERVKEAAKNHPRTRVRARARELAETWNKKPFLKFR